MADENTTITENEGAEENPTEGTQTTESGTEDTEDLKDSHGQPGINKERHDREMAEKDAKIANLEKQIADAAASKERAENLQKEIEDLKKEQADSKVTHNLEMAGCLDVKAAKARLEDFEGDVAKLKESCPYLFEKDKQIGSTGAKHTGAPDASEARVKRAREAAGLKPKE